VISVCVPYWKRQQALDHMFAEYGQLYAGWTLEFSVCDDGTPVPAKVPQSCILTRLPTKQHPLNPCVPINRAVAASTGAVVVLTNAEIMHRTAILPEMLALLGAEEERRYVMARCLDVKSGAWLAGPDVDYTRNGREPVPPGGHFHFLVMCWRALWNKAGGFDEDYRQGQACDDNDWLWRLRVVGARFVTTEGVVWHKASNIRWKLPSNRDLLMRKWHNELVTLKQAVGVQRQQRARSKREETRIGKNPKQPVKAREPSRGIVAVVGDPQLVRPRPGLVHPEWAMVLGGGEAVWDEVLAWEEIYGSEWDGLIIAANDVGSHWPRPLDHWCTLHPDKFQLWRDQREAYGFEDGYLTWGRQRQHMDYIVQPWAGGSSGMLAVQIAATVGCKKAILCGIPMTPTPHFLESIPHRRGAVWTSVAAHLRAWDKHLDKMVGWVRSMSGRTQEYFGAPDMEWLLKDDG